MKQRTFVLLFVGMLLVATGIIAANNSTHSRNEFSNTEMKKEGMSATAPLETIIWETMGQAILGSGSVE